MNSKKEEEKKTEINGNRLSLSNAFHVNKQEMCNIL